MSIEGLLMMLALLTIIGVFGAYFGKKENPKETRQIVRDVFIGAVAGLCTAIGINLFEIGIANIYDFVLTAFAFFSFVIFVIGVMTFLFVYLLPVRE